MHRPQNRRNVSTLVENGEESFRHMFVAEKFSVHQRDLAADELREIGMQASCPRCWAWRKTRINRRG